MSWNKRSAWLVAASVWFALAGPDAAEASIMLVDNFNAENGGVGVLNYTNFANFTVTAGSVDLIGNGLFDFYPGNGLYVDLNGSTGVSGTLTSKAVIDPGTYRLTFDIGNNSTFAGTNSVTVSLDGYSEMFSRTGVVPLDLITRVITVTAAAALVFATPAGDTDDTGIIIDNITLAAVPEPSTVAMIASTVPLGLGYWWRRRERAPT